MISLEAFLKWRANLANLIQKILSVSHQSHVYHVTNWITSLSRQYQVLLYLIIVDRYDNFSCEVLL